jgi:hypothetical protein
MALLFATNTLVQRGDISAIRSLELGERVDAYKLKPLHEITDRLMVIAVISARLSFEISLPLLLSGHSPHGGSRRENLSALGNGWMRPTSGADGLGTGALLPSKTYVRGGRHYTGCGCSCCGC